METPVMEAVSDMVVTVGGRTFDADLLPGGLVIADAMTKRSAFIPWDRVVAHSFPLEPGDHVDQIRDGSLSVWSYLAGEVLRDRARL